MNSSRRIEIHDVTPENLDDIIYVCSKDKMNDPVHREGIRVKKEWLKNMLSLCGSVGKVAYLNGKPVGQILYYPHCFDPYYRGLNGEGLIIACIYCPFTWAQRRGIGTRLLDSVIQYAKSLRTYDFVIANAFDTREFLPMPKFYVKKGFEPMHEFEDHYYLSLSDKRPVIKRIDHIMDPEDEGSALIFYAPVCQFFVPFAYKARDLILMVLPHYQVKIINYWKNPQLFLRKGKKFILVNGVSIKSWVQETEKFKQEVLAASQCKIA